MAHFAELDQNNVVLRVVVIDNRELTDPSGQENEELGIAFCKKTFGLGTNWKQTSYNGSFRGFYAGIGYTYREDLDAFIGISPHPSWILDTETLRWKAPIPEPSLTPEQIEQGCYYEWNEQDQSWVLITPTPQNQL